MAFFSSCCGRRRIRLDDEEALLAGYNDETQLQRRLHAKMHTYQMLRALGKGFMPSNDQLIINLRTLLSSDILETGNPELSSQGRRLIEQSRAWLLAVIELLKEKNGNDQIQDFIWCLSKARVTVDTAGVSSLAKTNKAKADFFALYDSLGTLGNLALMNPDFRIFLNDLGLLGRQVFADSALTLSSAAAGAAKQVEPTSDEGALLSGPGKDLDPKAEVAPLEEDKVIVKDALKTSIAETSSGVVESAKDRFAGDAKSTILSRLRQAVLSLRKRPDYETSVDIVVQLAQGYASRYSRALENASDELQSDIQTNDAVDKALLNLWQLLTSFGDQNNWEELQRKGRLVLEHANRDPDFEKLISEASKSLQDMLMDPDFFDHADQDLIDLKEKSAMIGHEHDLRSDIDGFLSQCRQTWASVLEDQEVRKLIRISSRLFELLSPDGKIYNQDLLQDSINVFVPLLVKAVQYIPLPRLEIATPDIDLLLENLILEPGLTINQSSFLPFRFRLETQNDIEIRKARFRTHSSTTTNMTIKLDGLSIRADELGYWMRAHSGLAHLTDEGLASFHLDERGMDVHIDFEIARERLEQILTLREVRVHIHHLDYDLHKSKFSWIAWILKPIIRPILRRTLEKQISLAIEQLLHAANRELLYARERLRAARISDPQSLKSFVRAILARLTPEEDPDLYTAFGVVPSKNPIFKGRYAPGSVVQLWEREVQDATYRVEDFEVKGWRNDIFDVQTVST